MSAPRFMLQRADALIWIGETCLQYSVPAPSVNFVDGHARGFQRQDAITIPWGTRHNLNLCSTDVCIHELAHYLDWRVNGRKYERHPTSFKRWLHGPRFCRQLYDLAYRWHGDAALYAWDKEYSTVRDWWHNRAGMDAVVSDLNGLDIPT